MQYVETTPIVLGSQRTEYPSEPPRWAKRPADLADVVDRRAEKRVCFIAGPFRILTTLSEVKSV